MAPKKPASETSQDNEYGIPQDVYDAILEEGRQQGIIEAVRAMAAQLQTLMPGGEMSALLPLDTPIELLNFVNDIYYKLKRRGYHTIGDMMAAGRAGIEDIEGFGAVRIQTIVTRLAFAGHALTELPPSQIRQ